MAWTKTKTAILTAAIIIVSAGTVTVIVREARPHGRIVTNNGMTFYLGETRSQSGQLLQVKTVTAADPSDWNLDLNSQTLEQLPPLLVLRSTKMPSNWVPGEMFGKDRYFARGKTVKELLAAIYSQKDSAAKLVFLAPLPDDKFDCVVTVPAKWWAALEAEIDKGSISLRNMSNRTGSRFTSSRQRCKRAQK